MIRHHTPDILEFTYRMALAAGKAILPHFRVALDVADKGGDARLRSGDRRRPCGRRGDPHAHRAPLFPITAFAARSSAGRKGTSSYTWVIDPIDGTRSFILGQMHWATLIALNDGERVVAGVAHQPYVGETFLAAAGPRRVAARPRAPPVAHPALSLRSAMPCSPAPIRQCFAPRATAPRFAGSPSTVRLTRWGGDCYAYCLLAMGFIDVVIESSLQAYDIQALMPIVEAAGGVDHDVGWRAAATKADRSSPAAIERCTRRC